MDNCVFVGNIPSQVSRSALRDFFQKFGEVKDVNMTSTSDCSYDQSGFITFKNCQSTSKALAATSDGLVLYGRNLIVGPRPECQLQESIVNIENREGDVDSIEPISIERLDRDCMLHIFSYLTLRQKIICEKVCTTWRDLSLESCTLVKEIKMKELLDDTANVSDAENIMHVLRRPTRSFTSLDLSHCSLPNLETELAQVLKLTRGITRLNLDYMPHPVMVSTVLEILQTHTPELQYLSIKCPQNSKSGKDRDELEFTLSDGS